MKSWLEWFSLFKKKINVDFSAYKDIQYAHFLLLGFFFGTVKLITSLSHTHWPYILLFHFCLLDWHKTQGAILEVKSITGLEILTSDICEYVNQHSSLDKQYM